MSIATPILRTASVHPLALSARAGKAVGTGPACEAAERPVARPSVHEPEADLIRHAASGSAEAFEEIVYRYERHIYSHLWRLVRSHEEAEDLAQETFLRAFRALESFDSRFSFRTWIFRIATNLGLSALRRPSRVVSMHDDEGNIRVETVADSDAAAPDAGLLLAERRRLAREAIRRLPDSTRAIVQLRYVEQFSVQDIATSMKMKPGTVSVALHRARATLQKIVEEMNAGTPWEAKTQA